jgi:hypothetical protein
MAQEKQNKQAEDFTAGAQKIQTRAPQILSVYGKVYKVKQLRKFARSKIDRLNREAYWCEQRAKQPISLKEAKRISRRLYTLHAKTAAVYLLGLKMLIPFAYALRWRRLMLGYDEVVAKINAAGASGDAQVNFSYANWEYTKAQLAHSTNLIGSGLEEMQKRMESARKQAEADAIKKKQGDK